MKLAVAVRIASEITGRVQLLVSPYLLEKLIDCRREPTAEVPAFSRFFKMDPGLCFMAMCLDRSMGAARYPPNLPGIDRTLSRIGRAGIEAIIIRVLALQATNGVLHRQALALAWLWRHCLSTALMAEELARELDFPAVEEAYLAGLFHDIGKIVLAARTPASCTTLLADPEQASTLLQAEAQVAGLDHGRLGARLIQGYTSAGFAADAARYHMASVSQVRYALPLVQIVWAANHLEASPHPASREYRTVAELLNLVPGQLNRICKIAVDRVQATIDEVGVSPDEDAMVRSEPAHAAPWRHELKAGAILANIYGELLKATDRGAIMGVLHQSLSVFWGIRTLIMFIDDPGSGYLVGHWAAGEVSTAGLDRLRIPLTAVESLPVKCHFREIPSASFLRPGREEDLTIIDRQLMEYMQADGIMGLPIRETASDFKGCLILGINAHEWPRLQKQTHLLQTIAAAVTVSLGRQRPLQRQMDRRVTDGSGSADARTRKIVHEINNPLSIIKNYLKVLRLKVGKNASDIDEIHIIDEEINRVAGLIKSLTVPAEAAANPFEPLDVNALIGDLLALLRSSFSATRTIRLKQELDKRIPSIATDRNLLKQVLWNLLKNAAEAMPEEGSITINSRLISALPEHAGDDGRTGKIRISVCDDGPGIDDAIKARLFMPNVTSKSGHDGLGLAIAHEAAMQLRGSLRCESAAGRGTCFFLDLPTGEDGNGLENALVRDSIT
jgi:putative nucleotidyltransferase with HDIG domain